MPVVKVLPKGQITLPKEVRKRLQIKEGDTLLLEEIAGGDIAIRKGKTIFDYIGILPNLGMSVEEMREKAIKEAAEERA